MRKPILAALLITNATVALAAPVQPVSSGSLRQGAESPYLQTVPAFIQQCRHYLPLQLSSLLALPPESAAMILERQFIGLNNLNDRLALLRQLPQSRDDRDALLNCQLHLADLVQNLSQSPDLPPLTQQLRHSNNAELQQLGEHLQQLISRQLNKEDKAKLHTAQASFITNLADQALSLNIISPECRLPPPRIQQATPQPTASVQIDHHPHTIPDSQTPSAKVKARHINDTVAHYLLLQPDAVCRQSVWQAYQGRAQQRNTAPLQRILSLRQQQAKAQGYDNYASFTLRSDYLNTPHLVWQFLQQQTRNIQVAPWDIGRQLKQLPRGKYQAQSSLALMQTLLAQLAPLGITVEQPEPHIWRLWQNGHLLGDWYLHPTVHSGFQLLQRPTIGHQFSAGILSYPEQIRTMGQQQQLIANLATAISLSQAGSRFYLNNLRSPSRDIGRLWLTDYLNRQLAISHPQPEDTRLALAKTYRHQLDIFRAKVALLEYENRSKSLTRKDKQLLSQAFTAGFGAHWPQAASYRYSFSAMVDSGPQLYLPLWQQAMATLIAQQAKADPLVIYRTLLINEGDLTLSQQLQLLLGKSVTPEQLIRRL